MFSREILFVNLRRMDAKAPLGLATIAGRWQETLTLREGLPTTRPLDQIRTHRTPSAPRATVTVPVPQTLEAVTRRPLWRRVVRKTVTFAAGAAIFIVVMAVVMTLCLGYYERQAKAERNKVQIGMTVEQVLPLVNGAGIRTHAVLPDNVSDEEGVHYATLVKHPDGTFGSFGAPRLNEDEALALMKQKMSDGYEWRWRYTFVNDTPQHFSFTVTFGRDGRVKDVTDVWGWD